MDIKETMAIVRTTSGEIHPTSDITEAKLFSLQKLTNKIAFKNGKQALEDFKKQKYLLD